MLNPPRLLFVACCAVALLTSTPLEANAQDLRVSRQQKTAARVALGFAMGTQVVTVGSGLVYAFGLDGALVPFAGATFVNPAMAVAGIGGFEGVMRDGTEAGFYRGLGTGFLQGGIYSLSVAALLGLRPLLRTTASGDVSPAFTVPAGVSYAGIGVGFTVAGVIMLRHGVKLRARRPRSAKRPPIQAVPVFSPSIRGIRIGVQGVF